MKTLKENEAFRNELRLALGSDAEREANSSRPIQVDADRLWQKIQQSTQSEPRSAAKILSLRIKAQYCGLTLAAAVLFLGTVVAFRMGFSDRMQHLQVAPSAERDLVLEGASGNGHDYPFSQSSSLSESSVREDSGHCNPQRQSCLVQNFL